MKNETERIFDAPWVLFSDPDNEVFQIESNSGNFVAEAMMFTEAKRLAILPELYDALAEAVEEACQDCVDETYQRTGMLFEPVNDGCIYPERDCCPKCRSWIEILRKVRDGK